MGGGVAGDIHASRLCLADRLNCRRCGDMGEMQTPTGSFQQAQVTLNHNDFRDRRDARQAQLGRQFAIVHHARSSQGRFFRVLNNQGVKGFAIAHGAAHDFRIRQRALSIREGDGTGF